MLVLLSPAPDAELGAPPWAPDPVGFAEEPPCEGIEAAPDEPLDALGDEALREDEAPLEALLLEGELLGEEAEGGVGGDGIDGVVGMLALGHPVRAIMAAPRQHSFTARRHLLRAFAVRSIFTLSH